MLVVTEAVKAEMDGVWAVMGKVFLRAAGFGPDTVDVAYEAGYAALKENDLTMFHFVCEQRLSARATRRRRGVKNDTRKAKMVTA